MLIGSAAHAEVMTTPRATTTALAHDDPAAGPGERFTGSGVMGLPFASGHYLALRDMTASSVGPPYHAIWHRAPDGRWTIFTTTEPGLSCPRYFGAGGTLRTGRIRLCGRTPNGQHFRAAPLQVWRVVGGSAQLDGHDLGPIGPLDRQVRLGDFWMPQRGLFFAGRSRFTGTGTGSDATPRSRAGQS